MTPSKERTMLRDLKAAMAANVELDERQSARLNAFEVRLGNLEAEFANEKAMPAEVGVPADKTQTTTKLKAKPKAKPKKARK